MKSDSTTVIKNMEFLVKELHKEWDRSGASKAYLIQKYQSATVGWSLALANPVSISGQCHR